VTGATNLNNSLTVTGPTDLKQGLTVAGGPTDLNQGLNVNGQTNIIGGINQQVTDINGGSRFAVDALGATITNQTAAGLARISASNGVISLDSNTQNNSVRGFSIASSTDSLNGARYSSGLTNGTQSTGLTVLPTATTLSGGGLNNPSQLSLTATGASFGNGSPGAPIGAPITVTGVADGVNPYDAVNMRQLNQMTNIVSTGVASIAAMSNIPDLSPTKKFGIGVGYGNFQGNSAVAIGASGRLSSALTVKASVGSGYNSNTSVGTGLTFSW
jgi:YadA-like membrane anchor domain/Coiled stalk of trimeric autotransporter adhesin